MRQLVKLLNMSVDTLIRADVFSLPDFNFTLYDKIKKNPVSIITNQCWGGYTYNSLDLRFDSPFINMFINNNEFFKLANNFKYYIEQPISFVREEFEENLKRNYPIASLGGIFLNFNHYVNFEEALSAWEKRKKRVNFDNLLFVARIDNEYEANLFNECNCTNKIGFANEAFPYTDIIYLPKRDDVLLFQQMNSCAANTHFMKPYNVLKLLLHEKDYMRFE